MFTNLSYTKINTAPLRRVPRCAIAEIIGEAIGAISLFVTGYMLLLIGHGLGLN
mgnify:CR=1 FL=1